MTDQSASAVPRAGDPTMPPAEWMAGWPIGRLLSTAARMMEHAWQATLEEHGLSHAGLVVLSLLGDGEASQRELAERARVQTQTMSRTLERLERDGLVTRVAHASDRRRHVVRRTEKGAEIFRTAGRLESELFPTLPDEAEFRANLLHVIGSAEPRRWTPPA